MKIGFINNNGIFHKFDYPIYENDTSPFEKGGSREIFQVDRLRNPPWPPFFKGGDSFQFKNDTNNVHSDELISYISALIFNVNIDI